MQRYWAVHLKCGEDLSLYIMYFQVWEYEQKLAKLESEAQQRKQEAEQEKQEVTQEHEKRLQNTYTRIQELAAPLSKEVC